MLKFMSLYCILEVVIIFKVIYEIRNQKSEIRNQKSEIRNQKSEIRNQKSEIRNLRNQKSEIRNQKSEIRNQKSLIIFHYLYQIILHLFWYCKKKEKISTL